jgi:hypothetical protein
LTIESGEGFEEELARFVVRGGGDDLLGRVADASPTGIDPDDPLHRELIGRRFAEYLLRLLAVFGHPRNGAAVQAFEQDADADAVGPNVARENQVASAAAELVQLEHLAPELARTRAGESLAVVVLP